jgi:hypothetical protein
MSVGVSGKSVATGEEEEEEEEGEEEQAEKGRPPVQHIHRMYGVGMCAHLGSSQPNCCHHLVNLVTMRVLVYVVM